MILVEPAPVPPPAPYEPLNASVTAAVTESDRDRIRGAAGRAGVSVSAFVRAAVLARLDGG